MVCISQIINQKDNSSCLITVCIVNYNSADFVLNTLYCLKKLTKNKYKIVIRDNNSSIEDFEKLKKDIKNYSNVELYRIENFNYTGSIAHGIAINELITKIDTKYGVILDADCTFLHKYWDEILINEINENYPIIGTQPPISNKSKKPIDFPLMYAIFFDTNIMKNLEIDFKPKNPKDFIDTGYELREKYLSNGYKGKLLKFKNTRNFKTGPFNKVICAEYYLNGHKNIFASHFGRGSSLGKSKYLKTGKKIFYQVPILGPFFLKIKGVREKNKWIEICKTTVNNTDQLN